MVNGTCQVEKFGYNTYCLGAVAELADAADLKSAGCNTLRVQVPPAPFSFFSQGVTKAKMQFSGY